MNEQTNKDCSKKALIPNQCDCVLKSLLNGHIQATSVPKQLQKAQTTQGLGRGLRW